MVAGQVLAIKVLLDHVEDMDRAHEYATKVDEPEVWSELAHVELDRSMVSQAIASYLRAGDASRHEPGRLATQLAERDRAAASVQHERHRWHLRFLEPRYLSVRI